MNRILPIVIVLVAIGLFFGYINPTYTGQVAELRAQIKSYDSALAAANMFKEKESALISEQASLPAGGKERIEAFLPDGVDNVQLILDLNALATKSGMRLSDFDISSGNGDGDKISADRISLTPESAVESLDVSVTAVGTYSAFRTFLSGVEWSLRPLDLIALTINDSTTGVYTYQMTLRIYWLR